MIQNKTTTAIMINTHKITLITVLGLMSFGLRAQSKPDTVIVNFGNSSKMVFYINEKGDLKALESYDLNAIVTDMSKKISADSITTQQEGGEQYLKDSVSTAESAANQIEADTSRIARRDWEDEEEDNWNGDRDGDDWDDRWSDDDNSSIVLSKKIGTNHYINFDLGINNYLGDGNTSPSNSNAPYTVKPWGSWYVAINSVHRSHVGGKLFLEWGGGISWYNFKFEDAGVRLDKTETDLQFGDGEGESFKKSKLTASFVNLNFVPVLDFGSRRKSGFRIGAGGYAGYRLGSHAKYIYKLDGNRERDKDKSDFYLNNLRYGLRLQLGFKGTDLFVNYDMNSLFSEGNAPKLNAFSFGITF